MCGLNVHTPYNLMITSVCPAGLRPLALYSYQVEADQQLRNNDAGETVTVPRESWIRQEDNEGGQEGFVLYEVQDFILTGNLR